jgi:hypothetical protein
LLNRVNTKIVALATKYRHAFTTLWTLDPHGTFGWHSDFLELRNQDVRGLSEAELPDAPTEARAEQLQARSLLSNDVVPEGNRTVSWIWRGSHVGNSGSVDTQNEFGEGEGSIFCTISTNTFDQSFDSSGQRPAHVRLVGRRKYHFSTKK